MIVVATLREQQNYRIDVIRETQKEELLEKFQKS